ncbi:MAG: hypothetical protein U5L72_15825 [Bacteroidales bacterium]|nr:hypothetical protein [Bacteroidales bacterium]
MQIITGIYDEGNASDVEKLGRHLRGDEFLDLYNGKLVIANGEITTAGISVIHARSLAENIRFMSGKEPYSGELQILADQLSIVASLTVRGDR